MALRHLILGAALAAVPAVHGQAALMNTVILKLGGGKVMYSGDLRVCNDSASTGNARVEVRPASVVVLTPGRCLAEWGAMLTLSNDGNGTVVIRYRSISKNNGRIPGAHDFPK